MLTLYFKTVTPRDLWSQAISVATGSPLVHVEALVDHKYFSSREPRGVAFSDIDVTDASKWIRADLSDVEITADAINWARSVCGCSYDWLGAIDSISPFHLRDSNSWFCSEVVAEFLSHCQGGTRYLHEGNIQLTPVQLYSRVTGKVVAIGDRLDALSDTLAAVKKAANDLDAKIQQFDMGNVNALVSEGVATLRDAHAMLDGINSVIHAIEAKI